MQNREGKITKNPKMKKKKKNPKQFFFLILLCIVK